MKIIFLLQDEEVYRFELPPQTVKAVFEFTTNTVYSDIGRIAIPVIAEIEIQPRVSNQEKAL